MEIKTRQFGVIAIEEEKILTFPKGLVGFESAHRFSLINLPEFEPYHWLQCVDQPEFTFVVLPMIYLRREYQLPLSAEDREWLHFLPDEELLVLAIVVVAPEITQSTANLLAPVVINERERLGGQIINERNGYRTRHIIKDEMQAKAKEGEIHAGADTQKKATVDARG